MGRGLDGFFFDQDPIPLLASCAALKVRERGFVFGRVLRRSGLAKFRWLLRRGNTSSHSEQRS